MRQTSLTKLAEAAETAAQVYVNVLRLCFDELRAIDQDLALAALDTLGDEEHAAHWFGTPLLGLSGLTPYQAAAAGRREDVLRILSAIEHSFCA